MADIPERCAHCAVRDASLCASMDDRELFALSDIARRRVVEKGQVVMWAGDRSTVCANIVSGVLKLATAMADGTEQTVGLLFGGDFVGQPFRSDTTFTATALTDADLCIYPRAGFEHVLDEHPRLERTLLRRTMDSLEDARARMLTLARKSAAEKVAGFLVEIAGRAGARTGLDGALSFDMPLSRGEMAELLGLTIETVSRQMTILKTSGIIALSGNRGITILQQTTLQARAERS